MVNKLSNKWWLFTILSGIFAYLNPYFGDFSLITVLILFFDVIIFIILKGHFQIVKKKILDKAEHTSTIKKIFTKEVFFFKAMKLFTTVCVIFSLVVIFFDNIKTRIILATYYIPAIEKNFVLQIICFVLAFGSIVFSFLLFCSYANSYKQKLNELE